MKNSDIHKDIFQRIKDMHRKEKERKDTFGDIKPIIQAEVKGKRFVAIGSKLHFADNWRTFPDFLYDYIMFVFGEDWFNLEISKPHDKRHSVMQWRYSIYEFQKTQKKNYDGLYEAIPTGPYKAYLTLAYDLYLLEHNQKLQKSLVNRLLIIDQFQGVRYELFVASTLTRAGYKIDYKLPKKKGQKVVEFFAIHKKSGQKIAIESKSRHRPGVLGRSGNVESPETIRIRLGQLINQAITKKPDIPYFIFIDMNLPPERIKIFEDLKLKELIKTLANTPKNEDDKDDFNMILYTNFPYHYGNTFESYPKDHLSVVFSLDPAHPLKNKSIMEQIQSEVNKYGKIPNFFDE